MKSITAAIMILMSQSAAITFASTPETFKLWTNGAPTDNKIPAGTEQTDDSGWTTYVSEPEITIYPADKPNGMAMMMCPGGGYFGLSSIYEGSLLAKDLNEIGVTLAVLKYRMPNGHHQVPAEDAQKALEILHDKANEYGIDTNKIGIGGASAGGHLATTIATHTGRISPAFQVLFYPVVTMAEDITHRGSRNLLLGENPPAKLVDYYSNSNHVSPSTPPSFIVLSQDDTAVPIQNSLDYFKALTANKVPVSLHIYPTGGHGWLYRPEFPHQQQALSELTHWLLHLPD